jgi:predicted helicase
MNETDRVAAIQAYLTEVSEQFNSGHAIEHAYRPALKRLMSQFEDVIAVNDPRHSEHGAPDFIFIKRSNDKVIKGHAEAKDVTVSLDKVEKTDQMQRYGGYANLFLTNYLEFRFFKNGEKYETISIGQVKNGQLQLMPENAIRLMRELEAFLEQAPERIRSGKRLAQIMGGKARRIRDNVYEYLTHEDIDSAELTKIYEMMKQLLLHDLEPKKFADMYAQTLVYGLFVARYGDTTPDSFTRSEARDLVPKSNPFLRHFFDHIVGPNFDIRLSYIVDELCEVFSVSDVQQIVHKHLRIQDSTDAAKDPIIHFYEDFLQEYDPNERKKMGAYYTPIPVVKYIIRHVDKILKEDFGITYGLASSETVDHYIETGQDLRFDRRSKAKTGYTTKLPRVQVLDPAVGTATFLNETIKFIHEQFSGQEGRWPAYVKDSLIKRLYGFELMMAPYTIAHLKLGMTLKETGVEDLTDRLGVYLTNTLEEGVPIQQDIFSFGLAEAVSDESRYAADIKSNHPVMVVMGNPPYSGESSNNTPYANGLIDKYKFEPGGQIKLQERNPKWLNDDYVKFIAFAENMIAKNRRGVVAMITNNGYLDNPTFRGMRWRLARSFDKIFILDLHGNAKKHESAPDGTKDVNVFDIMQGVSIMIAVKTSESTEPAEIYHAEVYGQRKTKFDSLNANEPKFSKIDPDLKNMYFVPKNTADLESYELGIPLNELMPTNSVGVVTSSDDTLINMSKSELLKTLDIVSRSDDGSRITQRLQQIHLDEDKIVEVSYRPFDNRYLYFDTKVVERPREGVMRNFIAHDNIGLAFNRRIETDRKFADIFIADSVMDARRVSLKETNYIAPLYIHHEDGTKTPNFALDKLKKLTSSLVIEPSPEDILSYIYAALHSRSYRDKYDELLKNSFPRVPIPTQANFDRLVVYGRQLRDLHLMRSSDIDSYSTTFPKSGDSIVEKIKYLDGSVWINNTQYFGNVPEVAWNFHIGGYQPAQKWLKDRKGRQLTYADLDHYQRIIKVLLETDRIMKAIG